MWQLILCQFDWAERCPDSWVKCHFCMYPPGCFQKGYPWRANRWRRWPSPIWTRVVWSAEPWVSEEGERMIMFSSDAGTSILFLLWHQRLCLSDFGAPGLLTVPSATNSPSLWIPDRTGTWHGSCSLLTHPSPVANHSTHPLLQRLDHSCFVKRGTV